MRSLSAFIVNLAFTTVPAQGGLSESQHSSGLEKGGKERYESLFLPPGAKTGNLIETREAAKMRPETSIKHFENGQLSAFNQEYQANPSLEQRNLQSSSIELDLQGSEIIEWNEDVSIDFSGSKDSADPNANLAYTWTCPTTYTNCGALDSKLEIGQLERLVEYEMYFGIPYEFTVKATSGSSLGSSQQDMEIQIKSPENSFSTPSECLDFEFSVKDKKGNKVENWREEGLNGRNMDQRIAFDTFNVTSEIYFSHPSASFSNCAYKDKLNSGQYKLLFTTYVRDEIFFSASFGKTYNWYYAFNYTDSNNDRLYFGNKAQFESVLSNIEEHAQKFYCLVYDSDTDTFVDWQSVTIRTRLNGDSIFAKLAETEIEIDSQTDLLVLDARGSVDSRGTPLEDLNFFWYNDQTGKTFTDKPVLSLSSTMRGIYKINQAGLTYTWSLVISDDTRESSPASVAVTLKPASHPKNCVTVGLEDVNIFTNLITLAPDTDEFKVFTKITTSSNRDCRNIVYQKKIWESLDLNWQHWEAFENDDSLIQINQEDVLTLPKMQNIPMRVSVYYDIGEISYVSIYDFQLFVNQEELEPQVIYSAVVNLDTASTVLFDGSRSYDPTDNNYLTKYEGISCMWTCPQEYNALCSILDLENCQLEFSPTNILNAKNYGTEITTKALPFTLDISKDTRSATQTVYFTALTDETFPLCVIQSQRATKLNQFGLYKAECANIDEVDNPLLEFKWKMYTSDGDEIEIPELGTAPGLDNKQFFRVNSLWFSGMDSIDIELFTVYDTAYYSTVRIREYFNKASKITEGSFRQKQSKVYAYNSELMIIPSSKWKSLGGLNLKFQVRAKTIQDDSYILMAPRYLNSDGNIKLKIPYTSNIYIDAVDAEGNYVTQFISKKLTVKRPKQILYPDFVTQVMQVIDMFKYGQTEEDFEDEMYELKMLYEALFFDIVSQVEDYQEFQQLCDDTVEFLYVQLISDLKLDKVTDLDRKLKISSDVVEILWSITSLNYGLSNPNYVYSIVDLILKPDLFYISENVFIQARKLGFICQNIQHYEDLAFKVQYPMKTLIRSISNEFLVPGETLYIRQSETREFQISRLDKIEAAKNVQMGTNITVPTNVLQSTYQSYKLNSVYFVTNSTNSAVLYLRSDAFMFPSMSGASRVDVNYATSPFWTERILENKNRPECEWRQVASNSWSNGAERQPTVQNGFSFEVKCLGTYFGLFRLTYSGEPAEEPIDFFQQDKGYDYGLFVPTVYLLSDFIVTDYIYDAYSSEFFTGLLVLIIFILLSNWVFYRVSVWEKNSRNKGFLDDQDPSYAATCISCCQSAKRSLPWALFKYFNPILNLMLVQNKFLERWLRSLLLQCYFMTFYVVFVFSLWLVDQQDATFGEFLWHRIVLSAALIIVSVILRPKILNLVYFIFYEPLTKIEEGDLETLKMLRRKEKLKRVEKTARPQQIDSPAKNDTDNNVEKHESIAEDLEKIPSAFDANRKSQDAMTKRQRNIDKKQSKGTIDGSNALPPITAMTRLSVDGPAKMVSDAKDKGLPSILGAQKGVASQKQFEGFQEMPDELVSGKTSQQPSKREAGPKEGSVQSSKGSKKPRRTEKKFAEDEQNPSQSSARKRKNQALRVLSNDSDEAEESKMKDQGKMDPNQLFNEGGEKEKTIDATHLGNMDREGSNNSSKENLAEDNLLSHRRRASMKHQKKYYLSRILGSVAFLLLWGLLTLLTLVLTYNLRIDPFFWCLEMTFICIAILMFVIDPVLYYITVQFMILRHRKLYGSKEAIATSNLVYFSLETDMKYRGFGFVRFFIGKRKMEDIERHLTIVQSARQMRRAYE